MRSRTSPSRSARTRPGSAPYRTNWRSPSGPSSTAPVTVDDREPAPRAAARSRRTSARPLVVVGAARRAPLALERHHQADELLVRVLRGRRGAVVVGAVAMLLAWPTMRLGVASAPCHDAVGRRRALKGRRRPCGMGRPAAEAVRALFGRRCGGMWNDPDQNLRVVGCAGNSSFRIGLAPWRDHTAEAGRHAARHAARRLRRGVADLPGLGAVDVTQAAAAPRGAPPRALPPRRPSRPSRPSRPHPSTPRPRSRGSAPPSRAARPSAARSASRHVAPRGPPLCVRLARGDGPGRRAGLVVTRRSCARPSRASRGAPPARACSARAARTARSSSRSRAALALPRARGGRVRLSGRRGSTRRARPRAPDAAAAPGGGGGGRAARRARASRRPRRRRA